LCTNDQSLCTLKRPKPSQKQEFLTTGLSPGRREEAGRVPQVAGYSRKLPQIEVQTSTVGDTADLGRTPLGSAGLGVDRGQHGRVVNGPLTRLPGLDPNSPTGSEPFTDLVRSTDREPVHAVVGQLGGGRHSVTGVSTHSGALAIRGSGSRYRRTNERAQLGKSIRSRVPRASHAELPIAGNRPDPVALLAEQAVTRVPELVPIRYGRMLHSPFAFFRGAALVMASDLAQTPRTGLTVQACGDAHMSNFGVFGSPERRLVFDVNDFDETLPGPWEWDIKRLAASLAVASRSREFTDKERRRVVTASAETYRQAMRGFAEMRNVDVWYARMDVDRALVDLASQLSQVSLQRTKAGLAKARTHDSLQALSKLTRVVDGQRRIISNPPLIVPIEEVLPEVEVDAIYAVIDRVLHGYRETLPASLHSLFDQFALVQMARKVVGVGSVGTRSWILLFEGRDSGDPLFLQAKEAQPSVLERFVEKSTFSNQGARVVAGQQAMQASSDILLGWGRQDAVDGTHTDFYFRQLRDWKGSVDVDQMIPSGMTAYARICGWTLARAHARSGDRIAIASYLGNGRVFDEAIATFSERYADQNQRDYEWLQRAATNGTITAEVGL